MYALTLKNELRTFSRVFATVAKISRKRGFWLVVHEKKEHNKPEAITLLICLLSHLLGT